MNGRIKIEQLLAWSGFLMSSAYILALALTSIH
jgi:hypothetical protein